MNRDKLFDKMKKVNPDFNEVNELVNPTGLPQQLKPKYSGDVKTLNQVSNTSTSINNAAKRIDNSTEFSGAFQDWFSRLGYDPKKISKTKIISDIGKILTNLGYR